MSVHIPPHLAPEWETFLVARALRISLEEAGYLDHAESHRVLAFTGIINHYGG